MPSIWENFNHKFELFQSLFFAFFFLAKPWAGDESE